MAKEIKTIGVLTSGGDAPGMNAAVRAVTLLGSDAGHEILGVDGGFTGLCDGRIRTLTPRDVDGWAGLGGAELGSRRGVLAPEQLYAVARAVDTHRIDALLGHRPADAAADRLAPNGGRKDPLGDYLHTGGRAERCRAKALESQAAVYARPAHRRG